MGKKKVDSSRDFSKIVNHIDVSLECFAAQSWTSMTEHIGWLDVQGERSFLKLMHCKLSLFPLDVHTKWFPITLSRDNVSGLGSVLCYAIKHHCLPAVQWLLLHYDATMTNSVVLNTVRTSIISHRSAVLRYAIQQCDAAVTMDEQDTSVQIVAQLLAMIPRHELLVDDLVRLFHSKHDHLTFMAVQYIIMDPTCQSDTNGDAKTFLRQTLLVEQPGDAAIQHARKWEKVMLYIMATKPDYFTYIVNLEWETPHRSWWIPIPSFSYWLVYCPTFSKRCETTVLVPAVAVLPDRLIDAMEYTYDRKTLLQHAILGDLFSLAIALLQRTRPPAIDVGKVPPWSTEPSPFTLALQKGNPELLHAFQYYENPFQVDLWLQQVDREISEQTILNCKLGYQFSVERWGYPKIFDHLYAVHQYCISRNKRFLHPTIAFKKDVEEALFILRDLIMNGFDGTILVTYLPQLFNEEKKLAQIVAFCKEMELPFPVRFLVHPKFLRVLRQMTTTAIDANLYSQSGFCHDSQESIVPFASIEDPEVAIMVANVCVLGDFRRFTYTLVSKLKSFYCSQNDHTAGRFLKCLRILADHFPTTDYLHPFLPYLRPPLWDKVLQRSIFDSDEMYTLTAKQLFTELTL